MGDDTGIVRRDPWGLGYGEHLLIWALRRIVIHRTICPVVAREFGDACGADGAEALATFRVMLDLLGRAARRQLRIGRPGWIGLTGDELQLISVVAAAQAEDQPRLDALLCWVVRGELRQHVAIAVRALAAAFAVHSLMVVTPIPAMIVPTRDSRGPRLVS
jgi:hypothetical protein